MKLRIPAEVYKRNWENFMSKYGKNADLENKLEKTMKAYSELPDNAVCIIKKLEAQKIADHCKKALVEKKQCIEDIESGKACLGYTTVLQEISAMRELVEEFEFTAICLAIFKKKYDLT